MMNDLPSLDGFFSWVVLTILSISTVVFVLEAVGLLPRRIEKLIYRKRSSQTLEVLRDLGFDVERVQRENRAAKITERRSEESLQEAAIGLTAPCTIQMPMKVGRVDAVATNIFIDLMGATCNPNKALSAAQLLSALWRNLISSRAVESGADFDFVAAPKSGSPMIAYEFARLHRKPLVLHNEQPKFASDKFHFASAFDAEFAPELGATALIVDDSTTGGRKAQETIMQLRDAGYIVNDFLVVFEPLTKKRIGRNAKERLDALNISLHSIIKTE